MKSRLQRTDDDVGRLVGARLSRTDVSGEVCPDAEVLAAYVDDGLAEAEVAEVDRHLARCPSCRALMARLSPIEAPSVAGAGGWRMPRIEPRWGSLAAMLIVGVVLWMAWPERSPVSHVAREARDASGDLPAVAPSTAASTSAPAAQKPAASAPSATAAGSAESARLAKQAELQQRLRKAESDAARELPRRPSSALADANVGGVAGPAPAPAAEERQAQEALAARRLEAQTAPSAVPTQGLRASAPAAVAAPPPPPPAAAEARPEPAPKAATAGARAGGGAASAMAANADKLRSAERVDVSGPTPVVQISSARIAAPEGPEFAEPEGILRWRIVGGRRIESSSDGGVTWNMSHDSGSTRLLAGSAPGISATWVCGASGVVLRRVYPGEWTRVKSPTQDDLVAITAASPTTARVTTRSGLVFETTDGGATWAPR